MAAKAKREKTTTKKQLSIVVFKQTIQQYKRPYLRVNGILHAKFMHTFELDQITSANPLANQTYDNHIKNGFRKLKK